MIGVFNEPYNTTIELNCKAFFCVSSKFDKKIFIEKSSKIYGVFTLRFIKNASPFL